MTLLAKNSSPRSGRELFQAVAAGDCRLTRFITRLALRHETVGEIIDDTFMVVWQAAPVGTVKARMYYAREKLRQYLPALGGGATPSVMPQEGA